MSCQRYLLAGSSGLENRFCLCSVLESFEHTSGILRREFQRIENAVTHFYGSLECLLLAAILAVGEVFGELIPLAADAQSPPLERGGLVGVAGNITLGHIVVAGLSTGCAYIATSGYF